MRGINFQNPASGSAPGKTAATLFACCLFVTAFRASTAQAAVIHWGAPRDIAGDTDVSTNGVLVKAIAKSGTSYPTVNGVTFCPAYGNDTVKLAPNSTISALNFGIGDESSNGGGTLAVSGTSGGALGTMDVGYKPHTGSSSSNVMGVADFTNGTVTGSIGNLYVGHMTSSQGSISGTGNVANPFTLAGNSWIETAGQLGSLRLATTSLAKNGAVLELTYTRSKAALAEGFLFTVEWSESLLPGGWSSTGVTGQILNDNGTRQIVRASLAAGTTASRFLRLRVTDPPPF